jgi:hypothetical protein
MLDAENIPALRQYDFLSDCKTPNYKSKLLKAEETMQSPELESFHLDVHDLLREDSLEQDGDSSGKISERKSNIKPRKTVHNNDGDGYFNFQPNDMSTSSEHNDNAQWEYPGQRFHDAPQENGYKSNFRVNCPSDEEKEDQWYRDRNGSHNAASFRKGDNRHYGDNMYSERDLSNEIFTGPQQLTQSYSGRSNVHARGTNGNQGEGIQFHGRYNDRQHESGHDVHQTSPWNDSYSGEYNSREHDTAHNVHSYRRDNNQLHGGHTHFDEQMMQQTSAVHHGENHHHICPHLLLQQQCEHKNVYKFFHKCCNRYHYQCDDCDKPMSFEEYQKRKTGKYTYISAYMLFVSCIVLPVTIVLM